MLKLQNIIDKIEKRIPLTWQEDWDHCGLNLGSRNQQIDSVLFSYDICKETIAAAKDQNCQMIVCHHPFRMQADVAIDLDSYEGELIKSCIENKIALYCMHTNHDASPESLNHFYLKQLQIKNSQPLWPHPLATTKRKIGLGAYGRLTKPLTKKQTLTKLKNLFRTPNIRFVDSGKTSFQNIGICTGSGSSFLDQAMALKLDLFITGDVKYHQAIHAKRHNLSIADVGHFYSENDSVILLKKIFQDEFGKKLKYTIYDKLSDAFEFL